jgi:hypothetical protein
MALDPIINDLRYVMETRQELDILNFYKSFPVTCKARVESIEHDGALLKVEPPGSVCLEDQEQTIVLSRGLPEAVQARVVAFDLPSGELRLDNFAYVGPNFGERMITRVQPGETINVGLQVDESQPPVSGTLVDVSLNGVGVTVPGATFQRGEVVDLTLPLPEGQVTLPGKVLNLTETPGQPVRLSIGFTRNAQEIAMVVRYVKSRRTEILAEVEAMYQRALQAKQNQPSDTSG